MTLLFLSLTGMIPNFVFADNFLPAKLINARTGESIAVNCLEKQDNQCIRFQYFEARSENGMYSQLSNVLDVDSVQKLLSKKVRGDSDDPSNVFQSKQLFFFSSTMFSASLLYNSTQAKIVRDDSGVVGDETSMMHSVTRFLYRRGDYESLPLYSLQAVGATIATTATTAVVAVPMTLLGLAIDIPLTPVRVVGKLFASPYVVTGAHRHNLKAAKRVQVAILTGNGNIYIKTNVWKKIRDGLAAI